MAKTGHATCYGQLGWEGDGGDRDKKWQRTNEQDAGELVAPWSARRRTQRYGVTVNGVLDAQGRRGVSIPG